MLKLLKSLTQTLGKDFRQQIHTNFLRIEDFVNNFKNLFDFHKSDEMNAHNSKQINDDKFGTVNNGLKVISKRYSNLVLSKAKNSLQEVKDARVDNRGEAHLTLFDRLLADNVRFETDKNEVMQSVKDAKDKVLAQEFAFDIPNQSWQYLTNLSPWTNAVMQSFHLDNRTGLIYMTQAYGEGYKLTKMKSNGQFMSQMFVEGGGHGTHNAYRWQDDKFWIYSFIKDDEGFNKLVRFSYRPDITITYGDYDMEEVFTGHPELPYITPIINEEEQKILYRIEYPKSEWETRGSMNYIEIRNLSDVDERTDKVIHRMDIPMRLTDGPGGQPMQGVAFGEGELYWYTGDSDSNIPNFVTIFDLKTGEQKLQKTADIGRTGNIFAGNFQEAEGIQLYYDKSTGKKALLAGVTVGAGNYRSHQVHGIFMRDVYDKLTAQALPTLQYETGGRTKTLPVENFTRLSEIIEPGVYYLYTVDTKNLTDFPLPKEMRDGGYFLEVSAPNQAGQVKQTLTRNTYERDIMQFIRIVSINKFSDTDGATNWNHTVYSSAGGRREYVPDHITNMNQLGIITNKRWYCDTARSSQLKDHPNPGVAGWTIDVENVSEYVFKLIVTRVTSATAIEKYEAYFSTTENKRTSPWTKFTGQTI
ncbi:phage baseplate protein [Staphylococcus caeli]|uniref:phage baseplate protein n=1 Tax=Staphylococcus caeli TaxID=2201815 RepID=UPI003F550CD8